MYNGRVVFQIDADTKSFDNQIEKVEEELNDLLNRYDETRAMKPFKGKQEDLRQLGVEIEKTANKLKGLKQQQDRATQGTASLGKESQKTGTQMSKGFENGLKSVKKLALGIVGIRGAYMLARKAASAYMSADEDLAKKMQSVWTGLGAFLAPLLEMLTNLMLKFVGYLNVFIKALTGKDLIAAANAKILEKQAKAQEKLNKATKEYQNYDFDVIRTQQTDTSSASGGGTDEANLIQIPELNQNVVKKLQDLAHWLKENKDLIEAVGIALGVTFGAIAIGKLLANIAALIGSGALTTGLLGLLAVLGLVAITWSVTVIVSGIKEVEDLTEKTKEAREQILGLAEDLNNIILNNPDNKPKEVIKQVSETEQRQGWLHENIRNAENIENELYYNGAFWENLGRIGVKTYENYNEELALTNKEMAVNVRRLIETQKAGNLTRDGYVQLVDFIGKYRNRLDEINKDAGDYKFTLEELTNALDGYADAHPEVIQDLKEFYNISDENEAQLMELYKAFTRGEIEVGRYAYELGRIPKNVSTKIETPGIVNAAKGVAEYVINSLGKVPTEKTTKIKVDDTDAKDKATSIGAVLGGLAKKPTIIPLKATLDDSDVTWRLQNMRSKLENIPFVGATMSKLFSGIFGFASGGYVSQPTLAWVGEGKSKGEYMIPDGEDYISRLASEIGQYGGGGTTNIYLDGRLIQRQVSKTANKVSFTRNGR